MRKRFLLTATLLLSLLTFNLQAQSKTGVEYFAGSWNMLIKGTPDGDAKLVFVLDRKDTSLMGVVRDTTGKELTKIDKIEVSGDKLTVYFNIQNYDVNVVMNKKDDDHVTGSLLSMFDVVGDRVKIIK